MIVVIFEVTLKENQDKVYLDIAAGLRDELSTIDGFISVERFTSTSNSEKLLSLSFWRDEEAVTKWRNSEQHRSAQFSGRQTIFEDYRIRVGTVIRDYSVTGRESAPNDSNSFHD